MRTFPCHALASDLRSRVEGFRVEGVGDLGFGLRVGDLGQGLRVWGSGFRG